GALGRTRGDAASRAGRHGGVPGSAGGRRADGRAGDRRRGRSGAPRRGPLTGPSGASATLTPMRAAFLALLAFLPGCFISVRSSGSDGTRHLDRSAADVRRDTRQRLAALELGMDRAAVDAVMGTRATFLGGAVGWVDSPHRESRYVAADGRAI